MLLALLAVGLFSCALLAPDSSSLPPALPRTPTFTPFQPLPSATLPGAAAAYPAPSRQPPQRSHCLLLSSPGEIPAPQGNLPMVWIDPALPPAFRRRDLLYRRAISPAGRRKELPCAWRWARRRRSAAGCTPWWRPFPAWSSGVSVQEVSLPGQARPATSRPCCWTRAPWRFSLCYVGTPGAWRGGSAARRRAAGARLEPRPCLGADPLRGARAALEGAGG